MVTLYRVTTEAEAIRLANEGEYGLSASVWTRDLRVAVGSRPQVVAGR